MIGGMAKIIEAYNRHGRHISPSVDNFARILFALIGGIFLLTPMVALAYISSKSLILIITVLFVLVFSITLALGSKSSNQELIAATAGYTAVLVVFVGNYIALTL
jgi:succinate-acetate transporter protein